MRLASGFSIQRTTWIQNEQKKEKSELVEQWKENTKMRTLNEGEIC